MSFMETLIDRLYYENRKDYTIREGNISYLDGSSLARPFNMPAAQRALAIVVVIAAIVIGLVIFNNTALKALQDSAKQQQAIEENLARPSALQTLPSMTQYAMMDANGIYANLQEVGYVIYDATQPNEDGDISIYKIPQDMTYDEAAALYAHGISGLDVAQATKLLNGSWHLETDNVNGTKVVRYADFTTADPQVAVQSAVGQQGFNAESIAESGVDDSGNTYSMGSFAVDENNFVWKVSALPIDDFYSITGLPSDACYVGIRVTRA